MPIRELDADLIDSVAMIAPEKSDNLKQLLLSFDPCAVFTNDKKFSFRVNTDSKEIKLPTVALEYLWCACYAFYVLYQEYKAENQVDKAHFDVYGTDRSKTAMLVYQWGLKQIGHSPSEVWPANLPKPTAARASDNEDIAVANELYLCSASWIIHHELAHIYCRHNNEPVNHEESRAQEREADDSATEWILGAVSNENVKNKRGLGVVIGLLVITTQDILAGGFEEKTHPKSFQRLYNVLEKHFNDEDHLVYTFSVVILHLHMVVAGMNIEMDCAETWKANLEKCLLKFSRLNRP